MKLKDKSLTGVAAKVSEAQAVITEAEKQGAQRLEQYRNQQAIKADLLNRLEAVSAEREIKSINLDTPPAEIESLKAEAQALQKEIDANDETIAAIKTQFVDVIEQLQIEQDARQTEATDANDELFKDILQTDEMRQAWAYIQRYYLVRPGLNWNQAHSEFQAIESVPSVDMPALAKYRGSEVLEDMRAIQGDVR